MFCSCVYSQMFPELNISTRANRAVTHQPIEQGGELGCSVIAVAFGDFREAVRKSAHLLCHLVLFLRPG